MTALTAPPPATVVLRHAAAARPIEAFIAAEGIELAEEQVKAGVRFPVLVKDGKRIPFFAVQIAHPRPIPLSGYVAEIGRQITGPRVPGQSTLEGRNRTEFHLRILLGTSRFQNLSRAYLEALHLDTKLEREHEIAQREPQFSYAL